MSFTLYHDTYPCTSEYSRGDLVLLHGWGMNSHVWDSIMPGLLARYRVTVIDLPGMGRSPLPSGEYTMERLVSLVLQVAPSPAHWMGWSLGGMIAIALSARHPESVLSLTTFGTNACFLQRDEWLAAMPVGEFDAFETLLEEDAQGTVIRFLALQCKGSISMRDDIRMLRERVFHDGLPATRALREGLALLAHEDLRREYESLRMPVLNVLGDRDALVPVTSLEAMGRLLPHSRFALLQGSAHLPFLSDPDTVLLALDDFWQECKPS